MTKREQIAEMDGEMESVLYADGFDDAIIGYVEQFGRPAVALYDQSKMIEILMRDGMTVEEALEYFEFNVLGSWVGEYTPAFAVLLEDDEK